MFVFEKKIEEKESESNDQKIVDDKKSPNQTSGIHLDGIGYIPERAINFLSNKIGDTIELDELENNLKQSIENRDVLYYEYKDGDPVECASLSDKTVTIALDSGFQDMDGEPIYVQFNKGRQGRSGVYFNTKKQIFNSLNSYRIGRLSFRNYTEANDFIKELHDRLLPGEVWKYAKPAKNGFREKTEYEILESYLGTVLAALTEERALNKDKIKLSKGEKYALFNTGLLSKFTKDILVVGEVYRKSGKDDDEFDISNPSVLKGGKRELIEKGFSMEDENVDMVSFFTDVSQIVYDATKEIDFSEDKLNHCIIDGIERNRFPKEYKEQYKRKEIDTITQKFIQAIDRAKKIARRNYKYVVPQYRSTPNGSKIQFLMPIYMDYRYDDAPDFALVLSEEIIGGEKFYIPETVLDLAWAYNNARVICKPDDTWLNPNEIEDSEDMDEAVEEDLQEDIFED